MSDYQRARDEAALPMYEFTCQLATLSPPPPEVQQLIGAIYGNQSAMDGFAQMNAGTISPAEFLSPANIGTSMAQQKSRTSAGSLDCAILCYELVAGRLVASRNAS